ncbi:MAG: right-handed parallel beta-helix repeat-containing protein [Candidatus Binatia bacterium]
MKHATPPTGRLIALIALPALLACATSASAQTPTPSPTPEPLYACSGRINTLIRNYTKDYLQIVTSCERARLDTGLPANCATDQDTLQAIDSAADSLAGEIAKCTPAALDAFCPLGADVPAEFPGGVNGTGPDSLRSRLAKLVADIFTTPFDGCTRPAPGTANTDAVSCATALGDTVTDALVEPLEAEFFNCERDRIKFPSHEICVDDVNGEPSSAGLLSDQASVLAEVEQIGSNDCGAPDLATLGCPLGASSLEDLQTALSARVAVLVQELNVDVYHSDCQGPRPGEPSEPVPADVTLEPSMRKKKLGCGQTIDSAFMNGDNAISFDSDLDCGPSPTATDGIVVAKDGLKLSGRAGKLWSIRGPRRSSLRTGAGIKLLPGVARVQIRNFKAIENFGVGILDAEDGTNKKLQIVKTTVRRNIQAGLRIRSQRAVIDQVTADKNGIGMDLSGDGIKVKGSSAKGSAYPPKVGIQLSGVDRNLSGSVVVISPLNTIELNGGVGIHVLSGAHFINQNDIKNNVGNGIEIDPLAAGTLVKQNSVKSNVDGIVVNGDQNTIDGNACEDNLGDGYVIAGTANVLMGNGSGAKTEHGNGGVGYRITGSNTALDTNHAEANLGSGFVVTGTPTTFTGNNTAEVNHEHGFDIQSAGNTFEGCGAEGNNVDDPQGNPFHEWVFVAGQIDGDGNSAGGDTIGLPSSAGFCDSDNDCPRPK